MRFIADRGRPCGGPESPLRLGEGEGVRDGGVRVGVGPCASTGTRFERVRGGADFGGGPSTATDAGRAGGGVFAGTPSIRLGEAVWARAGGGGGGVGVVGPLSDPGWQ